MNKILAFTDFLFNKLIPKKFLVWSVATFLAMMGNLDGDLWAYISMLYIGGNVIQKFAYMTKDTKAEDGED